MKIYNKKKFYFSLLWLAMGISVMIFTLVNGDLNFNSVFRAACCYILGINGLGRSISQKKVTRGQSRRTGMNVIS